MIDITAQKEAASKAAKTATDGTVEFAGKAKDLGMSSAKTATDGTVEFAGKAKDLGMSSAKTATETASQYMDKAVDFGGTAADSATDIFKSFFERAQSLTGKGFERVGEVPLGEKNVGERAQATVDTVQDKIDVDQIQDQVAKLREQMEHVMVSWKDSFRPSTTVTEEPTKKAPAVTRKQLTAMSKDDLVAMARDRDLSGRSSMTKSELVKALAA